MVDLKLRGQHRLLSARIGDDPSAGRRQHLRCFALSSCLLEDYRRQARRSARHGRSDAQQAIDIRLRARLSLGIASGFSQTLPFSGLTIDSRPRRISGSANAQKRSLPGLACILEGALDLGPTLDAEGMRSRCYSPFSLSSR